MEESLHRLRRIAILKKVKFCRISSSWWLLNHQNLRAKVLRKDMGSLVFGSRTNLKYIPSMGSGFRVEGMNIESYSILGRRARNPPPKWLVYAGFGGL